MSTIDKGSKPGPIDITTHLHTLPSHSRPCIGDPQTFKILQDNFSSTLDNPAHENHDVEKSLVGKEDGGVQSPSAEVSSKERNEEGEEVWYPEGGREAWLVAFGAFCSMTAGFGPLNSIGIFQAYISEHQLSQYSASTISWIFGLYVFFTFFCGLQIGPIFDAKGPRALIFVGSVCQVLSFLLLGLCTEYYQFMLSLSVLGGLGTSLLFTPAVGAIAHFFSKRRGTATGTAATGGSFGGIIFPLILQALIPKIGWAWATRVIALICLVLCTIAIVLVRSRLPPKKGGSVIPHFRVFFDGTGALALTTAGIFLIEYAVTVGIDESFSYQIMAIFNAGSCVGRYVPGYFADHLGRYNTMLITVMMCIVTVFGLWLPAEFTSQSSVVPLVVTYAVLFGFASGSNISLTPICVGQLCDTNEFGRYYATCYTIVSFGSLTGLPIAGALIKACGGKYWGLILFAGVSYVLSFVAFATARVRKCGWNWKAIW